MKRLALAALLTLFTTPVWAQCNGIFPNNTVCGNVTGSGNLPSPTSPSAFLGAAGGLNGQIQYNNAGALGGFTASGDFTINTGSGVGTLANTAVTPGTYGDATHVPQFTVDSKGRITAATSFFNGGGSGVTTPIANGAACDVIQVTGNTSISSGTAALTVVGANFQVADVGKVISVPGAGTGGTSLNTTILSRTSTTQVTLNANAGSTLSAVSKTVTYGTNDTTAFQTMFALSSNWNIDLSRATSSAGCMITDTITQSARKYISGGNNGWKLFFRQSGSAAGKSWFSLGSGAAGSTFTRFSIDTDIGTASSRGNVFLLDNAATQITFSHLEAEGNRATTNITTMFVNNFTDGSNFNFNYIHGFTDYIIAAAFNASDAQVIGNRVIDGPKNSIGYVFAFLSSGQAGPMRDLTIHSNYIDTSNLAIADQTVGIYVFGGSPGGGTASYNNISISGNTIVGTLNSTTTTSAGILVTQATNVVVANNNIKFMGEGIGGGANYNIAYTGNTLYGNGTYSIESNGDTNVTIVGNSAYSAGISIYGIVTENMINGTISSNSVDGTGSAAGYQGIVAIGVSNSTGASTLRSSISSNSVVGPNNLSFNGIRVQCNSGATSCSNFAITGNTVDTAGTIATGATGIWISRGGSPTVAGFLIGPNFLRADVGVLIDAGITGICYVTGRNASNTAITNNGAASSCT